MVQVRKKGTINYAEAADSDSESDLPKTNRKAKAERNAASPKVARATPAPANQRKRRAAAVEEVSGDASLLEIVKKHGTALSVAAKDWIQSYKENRTRATAQLLTFLIQACGTEEVCPEEELEELEVDQLKQELDARAQEEGLDDPFKAKGQKNFRSNYLELWDKIIREAYHADVLFDQYLLDKVINLLIALNTSVVRDFRRVATLTAVQLVTSFIHITGILTEGRATAERQLAVEEKKKGGKGGNDRIAAFKRTVDRTHARISELADYTDSIFQAVCQHRFRDCAEDIRATVIEGIGHWIRSNPSHFLGDQYLKYIAWALSDKDAVVRSCAASALLGLYGQRDNLSAMHEFTERFSARFKELIYDVDESVAMKGVQLLTVLVRLEEISAASVKEVYTLLGDDSHGIRHAVAELVGGMLQEQGERALKQTHAKSTGKKQRRKSTEGGQVSAEGLQLAGLLHLMHLLANEESANQEGDGMDVDAATPLGKEVAAQVVDALFDRVEVLQNWALMVEWIKGSKAAEHFGEAGVTNLVHVLRHALCKATGGQLLGGLAEKKGRAKERQDAQAAARQDATLVLMKELPTLLKKLQTNPAQAAAIVGILPELKLEIYSLKRQDKGFASLVSIVKDIMFKHDDMQVAFECVRALAICSRDGTDSIKDAALLGLRQCCEEAVKRLVAAVDMLEGLDAMELSSAVEAFQEGGEEEELEVLYNCRIGLGRLRALQQLDSNAAFIEAVYDALNRLLEAVASDQHLTVPIARSALDNLMLLLLWQLRALDAEHPEQGSLMDVAQKRSLFVTQLESIMDSEQDEVKDEACRVLSDLCLCFSAEKMRGTPLEEACFRPSDSLVGKMWRVWEGVIEQQPAEDADEEGSAKLVAAKVRAASKACQLVMFQAIPQRGQLAAQLVSHYVGSEKEVTEAIKELCRLLKKVDPNGLPGIHLEALKASYTRAADQLMEDADDDQALDQFVGLAHRIAQAYAGFNASAPALAHISANGAVWALQGAPERLPFLQGVACFLGRLPAPQAQAVLREVEAAAGAAPSSKAEAEYPWDLYFDFVDLLNDRVAKATGPKSVLKRGGAGGSSVKNGSRKIAFAAAEGIEEASDEEQENQEPDGIEEEQQEEDFNENQPGPSNRHAQQAAARRGRQTSSQQQQAAMGRLRQQVTAGGTSGSGGWKQARHGTSVHPAPGRQHIEQEEEREEESEEEEEEEPEEEEEEEVLPTEEQLPMMRPAGTRAGRHRHPKMQPIFNEEEDAAEDDEAGTEDVDADLPDIKGRSRHASVVDPEPEAQQNAEAGGEDEDDMSQEVRRARRRRRQ